MKMSTRTVLRMLVTQAEDRRQLSKEAARRLRREIVKAYKTHGAFDSPEFGLQTKTQPFETREKFESTRRFPVSGITLARPPKKKNFADLFEQIMKKQRG